ncbi:MAG TPA: J domain-containing protein [Leucothrix mucor]|uniref:J domain-containing protein n=1 Tax=Leucothrix mucor TaxID=45248 RepID=A0A7V2T054_LEUMU|nr:J domain-containing protein [Leucothrix mucor]
MKSEAIRCAIKLNNEPALLVRFGDPQRKLPRGITELLRIVSSDAALKQISKKNNIDAIRFRKILLNYIQEVLLKDNNSDLRVLGLDQTADNSLRRLHYRLLMNVFHPDKFDSTSAPPHYYTQRISKSYKNIKNKQVIHKVVKASKFSMTKVNIDHYQKNKININRCLREENNDVFVKNNWMLPAFSLFLITAFIMLFMLTPSSPQIVVKKTNDEVIQDIASRQIDLLEEKRRSTTLNIRDQQQLSKK